ncbi:unnamed protein product, partial [Brachionus calyciflorus]
RTILGGFCQFPFVYNGIEYKNCITNNPNNTEYLPMCLTSTNVWEECVVPTNAIVTYVTTRKNGGNWINSLSKNGGTMIWIYGRRFAQNLFSFTPSADTTNQVFLTNEFNSYECTIHPDKVTAIQITCYAPPMVEGTYMVRVLVNGYLIPYYQYLNIDDIEIRVIDSATPKLNSIQPKTAPPGSMLTLTGDFKTLCYTRDVDPCADDSGSRISRIYFGGQTCNLMNPLTNDVYQNLTTDTLVCKLEGHEVNLFNATVLVSEEFGRSQSPPSLFYISPNDKIYNFMTYSEINGINIQNGSTQGGLKLTLTGNHFYSDQYLPANIKIADTDCKLVNFQQNNYVDSTLECETSAKPNIDGRNYFFGGRGINLVVDDVLTTYENLETLTLSGSANYSVVNEMSVNFNQQNPVTALFKGFFAPEKNGNYDFPVETNGYVKVFLSTSEDPNQKTKVTSYKQGVENIVTKKVLQAGKLYYFEAKASSTSGIFSLKVNGRLYETSLVDTVSSNVINELQNIEIKSTITNEDFSIDYKLLTTGTGVSEIQKITLNSSIPNAQYILSFRGVETIPIEFDSTSLIVQNALNDLPSISPNLVTVNSVSSDDANLKIYRVTFPSDLGDVPDLIETTGHVALDVNEETKGVSSGAKVQLNIEDKVSPLFNIADSNDHIKDVLNKTFGIQCPASILAKTADVHVIYDYETCLKLAEGNLNETVFCGQCSIKDSSTIFSNGNTPIAFKQLCFAYKFNRGAANKLNLEFKTSGGSIVYKAMNIRTIADRQWHYNCFDIVGSVDLTNTGATTISKVYLSPFYADSYLDAASLRKTLPFGYNVPSLITTRRLYPTLTIIPSSLKVVSNATTKLLKITYRPNNCMNDLTTLSVLNFNDTIQVSRLQSSSRPVIGYFSLSYGSENISNIPADITAESFKVLLESVKGMGQVTVTRTNDCAGYKWQIRFETGGDKPLLTISEDGLMGNSPVITSAVAKDGHALFTPLFESFFRTFHTRPQVTVNINNIVSKCVTSCDFEWLTESTPQITSIDVSNPSLIVLTGTGFDSTTISNNLVYIGDVLCTVNEATSTQLKCIPGDGPLGVYNFKVVVVNKGLAELSAAASSITFTYELDVTAISPSIGGTGGGTIVNITGKGFTQNSVVTIDGNICKVKSFNYKWITCQVPSSDTNANKTVDVVVTEGSDKTLSDAFFYDYDNTPKVTSVSNKELSVLGDETILINGTFTTTGIQVFIGSKLAKIISNGEGYIQIKTPSMNPGLYPLVIPTGAYGNVKVDFQFEYVFYVSSFSPKVTSKRGGSRVVVYGSGFNTEDCSLNQVKFERYECKVISCTLDSIICETQPAHTVYQISNKGLSSSWGEGYAWTEPYIEINIGDIVEWSWSPPTAINGLNFKVEQVKGAFSRDAEGFSSGQATSRGSFSFQFNTPGTYYYWSGYIEPSRVVHFFGTVVVKDVKEVKDLEIKVLQDGIEALKCASLFTYKSTNYTDCTNTDLTYNWCSSTFNADDDKVRIKCVPQTVVPNPGQEITDNTCDDGLTNKYAMRFTDCDIPTITSISPSVVTYATDITINGTGFSTNTSENVVTIGGISCQIKSVSETEIICNIGRNSSLQSNTNYTVEIKVINKGYALKNNNWLFVKYQSTVKSISSSSGSTNGGALIYIEGDGFNQNTKLIFGDKIYTSENSQINYVSFNFTTQPSFDNSFNISMITNELEVFFETEFLTYTFDSSLNPIITSITPNEIDRETNITILGENFVSDFSDIAIQIGNQNCEVLYSNSTMIECNLKGLDLGANSVALKIKSIGNSNLFSQKINGIGNILSITPNSGSTNGGTRVKLNGNGFSNLVQVKFGNVKCLILSVKIDEIVCESQKSTAGSQAVSVNSSLGVQFINSNNLEFNYDTSKTPLISEIYPLEENSANSVLTLIGDNFGTDQKEVHVQINGTICIVTYSNSTFIECTLGRHSAGTYPIDLRVDSFGFANRNISFVYSLNINSLSSNGGSLAGGLKLKIFGSGFSNRSQVSICNKECKILNETSTELLCLVPVSNSTVYQNCSLVVKENGLTASSFFEYKPELTPSILDSSPKRGGTGGGTIISITGQNFPTDQSKVSVLIAGIQCEIRFLNSSFIECRTGPHPKSSIKALIQVYITDVGNALNSQVFFEYIDLWSSIYTWGGMDPPIEGDLVIISEDQTVYFDTNTPVLKGIIIIGGALIFDDMQDVHLKCEYIVIVDGGRLEIGTEQKPFMHKAEITMYGSARSIELPIFGSKVIAVRNGTLDMHGKPVGVTWTHLGETANAGSTQIKLKEQVIWEVGSEIVIATTGDKYSPGETEVRTIVSKANDNQTLTLDKPLNFTHLCEVYTVGEGANLYKLEKKAEVGLLTRNIKYRGHNDDSWNSLKTAKACPQGFNPSEFAVQTCYLGRYGDEIGSDEFGATIMLHADMDAPRTREYVIARIQNVELYHVGQSFRIGRYPIHFHLNGDMRSSYVKEISIRKSFNRAINIHGSNYVTISRNFIYDIMGGAYFLEDGVEIGNEFSYNLAIFVKSSSSLLNEDSTPAAYWVTNPNNTVIHNANGGNSHFGFWYRILDRPDGPSFNQNYCPKKIPLGRFFNNSVHSSGRMGLWIFPGYTPTVSGACWDSRPKLARFESLTTYGNEKGCEWVFSNSVQLKNFLVFDEHGTGIETKNNVHHNNFYYNIRNLIPTFYNESTGTAVLDSVIVGNSNNAATKSITTDGLVLAWDRGQLIKNVTFINFKSGWALRGPEIIGTCTVACGGWVNKFKDLKFINVQTRTLHRWDWDLVYDDLDGSLTGSTNNVVVYNNNFTANNPNCTTDSRFINGTICKNTKGWIRFAYNNLDPSNVARTNVTNYAGQMATTPKLLKRLTHKLGFMTVLEANQEYLFEFDDALYPTNVSYSSGFYNVEVGKWIIIKHRLWKKPDRVYFGSALQLESFIPLTNSMQTGSWHWDNTTQFLSYIINNKNIAPFADYDVQFNAYVCRYVGCEPPIPPGFKLPVTERPANALFWSNIATWSFAEPGWGGYVGTKAAGASYELPRDGQSVKIPDGKYVVVDTKLPILKYLQIEGVLEFDNGLNHTLNAEMIFINGGQLIIGWEKDPILNNVEIILRGRKDSLNFQLPDGMSKIGGKGIGVYGGLDLHGKPRIPAWTTLANTTNIGSNKLVLSEPVDWEKDELISIGSTSYHPNQTEVFRIVAKSSDNKTLTLNSTVKYDHLAYEESYPNGQFYRIAAPVGLLTRNIKIIGEAYDTQYADLYGTRTIVSDYSTVNSDGLPTLYKGYARLSDVEFDGSGQYSRNDGDDYKYGILFSNLGQYNYSRPSYVRNCAFHHGYATAIGILGSQSIPIENNVIHQTIDIAIYLESHSNIVRKNLIMYVIWSSSILTWTAEYNVEYWGAINAHLADSAVIEDNFIDGVERLGLYYKGEQCQNTSEVVGIGMNHSINRNTIYSSLSGAVILPDFFYENLTCVGMRGFTIFKAMHWGIYYQGPQSIILDSNKLIDNFVSAFTYVVEPSGTTHIYSGKFYENRNSLIVGQSKGFNCLTDVRTYDLNYHSAKKIQAFGAGPSELGKVGLVWSNFLGGPNGAPGKPFAGLMTWNAVAGRTLFNNLTITNFNEQCGVKNYVISTNQKNDDAQHPVMFNNTHLYGVENGSKVWIHRPNLNKINIWDCIDMDCDALKKALLNDLDGSFLGDKGSVIPQSEFAWGSQQRGLGDFRIPKELLAAPNGSMIPPSQAYKFPGIVRDDNLCQYVNDWQAYKCRDLEHRVLLIESMDPDTLTRRLSPVAILVENKYLDLINGPQDQGCCFGYTCLKRLSLFMAIVINNQNVDVYLTSTAPKQLRFRLLNADDNYKVRLSMHYFTSNRIDLYKNDRFVPPTNAFYLDGKMQLSDTSSNLTAYMPSYLNSSGTNLAVRDHSKVYFTIGGSDYIDLKVTPTIFVKFGVPAVTDSSFFDKDKIVQNFAALLGIPANKIRNVQIISESRKRRAVDGGTTFVALTIMEDPIQNISETTQDDEIKQQLNSLTASIINRFSTGELEQAAKDLLNVTLTNLLVQKPNSNGTDSEIKKINNIVVVREADQCKEMTPCFIQPILKVLDENNQTLLNMDNEQFPWVVEAELYNCDSPTARIVLQTEAKLQDDGFVRFENLSISQITTRFQIRYRFKTPTGLTNSTYIPPSFDSKKVTASNKAEFSCVTIENNLAVVVNKTFTLTVSVTDKISKFPVKNLDWKNHTWEATIAMYQLDSCETGGKLQVNSLNTSANLADGLFSFENLYITKSGMYLLIISIKSSDNEYSFSCVSKSVTVSNTQVILDDTIYPSTFLRFSGNFADYKDKTELIKAKFFNCYLAKYGLTITTPMSVYEGSIMINFDYSGTAEGVTQFSQDVSKGISMDGLKLISATLNDKEIKVALNSDPVSNPIPINDPILTTKSSSKTNLPSGFLILSILMAYLFNF